MPIELLLKEDDEALQPSNAVVLLLDQRIAQDAVELDAQLALLFAHRILKDGCCSSTGKSVER